MKKTEKEDRLISDIMKDFRMESPSPGFTEKVMQGIQLQGKNVKASGPLIGRSGWIGIAAGLGLLLGLLFLEYDNAVPEEAGWLEQRLPLIGLPSVNFSIGDLFSWINLDSPALFWISIGIGGIVLLGFLQQLIDKIHLRNIYTL